MSFALIEECIELANLHLSDPEKYSIKALAAMSKQDRGQIGRKIAIGCFPPELLAKLHGPHWGLRILVDLLPLRRNHEGIYFRDLKFLRIQGSPSLDEVDYQEVEKFIDTVNAGIIQTSAELRPIVKKHQNKGLAKEVRVQPKRASTLEATLEDKIRAELEEKYFQQAQNEVLSSLRKIYKSMYEAIILARIIVNNRSALLSESDKEEFLINLNLWIKDLQDMALALSSLEVAIVKRQKDKENGH